MLLLELSVSGMKWLSAAIIFLASFGGGLLPFLLKRRSVQRAEMKKQRQEKEKRGQETARQRALQEDHTSAGSTYAPPVHSGSLQADDALLGLASPLAPAPSDAPADALRQSESFRARHPDAHNKKRRRTSAAALPSGAARVEMEPSGAGASGYASGHGSSSSKPKRKRWCHMNVDRFLSLGNMMGAGIFLGGGLMHLLPEAQEDLHEVQHEWEGPDWVAHYPITFLLCSLGFFTILIVEEVVIAITTKNKLKKEKKLREEKEEAAAKKRAEAKQARLAAGSTAATSTGSSGRSTTGFIPIESPSTPSRSPLVDVGTPRGSISGFDSECGTPVFDRSASPFGDPLKRDLEHNLVQGLTTRIMLLPAMPFRKPRRRRTQRRRAAEAELGSSVAAGDHSVSVSVQSTAPMAIRPAGESESSGESDESAGPIQQFLDAAYNSPSPFPSLTAADPLITRRLQSRMRHANRSRRGSYPADDSDSNMIYAAAASAAAAGRGGADSPSSDLGSPLVTPNTASATFDFGNAGSPTPGSYLASSRALASGNGVLGREETQPLATVVAAAPAPLPAAFSVPKPSTPASVVALRQPLLVKPDAHVSESDADHAHDHSHSHSKEVGHHGHGHGHGHGDGGGHSHVEISAGTSYIVAYLLVLALSFHNIFEGIALGTQSDFAATVSIFVAVLAHSPLAGFALGVSLVKARATPLMLLSCLFIFSFMTLAGAALGLGLSYVLEGDALTAASACFQSFSAGTFLFVALEEIIPKEMAMPKDKALKLFLCVLGFMFMAVIKIFDSD